MDRRFCPQTPSDSKCFDMKVLAMGFQVSGTGGGVYWARVLTSAMRDKPSTSRMGSNCAGGFKTINEIYAVVRGDLRLWKRGAKGHTEEGNLSLTRLWWGFYRRTGRGSGTGKNDAQFFSTDMPNKLDRWFGLATLAPPTVLRSGTAKEIDTAANSE